MSITDGGLGFVVPNQPSVQEVNDWIIKSGLQNQNKQAFNTLYSALQDIGTITQRGIKDGEAGHKKALQKIMEICRGVE